MGSNLCKTQPLEAAAEIFVNVVQVKALPMRRGAQSCDGCCEELVRALFDRHDLNRNGVLEEWELIQLNQIVALMHHGFDVDREAIAEKYRRVFRTQLNPSGRPVRYETFRQYIDEFLHAIDPDQEAQTMILEQFISEADLALEYLKSSSSRHTSAPTPWEAACSDAAASVGGAHEERAFKDESASDSPCSTASGACPSDFSDATDDATDILSPAAGPSQCDHGWPDVGAGVEAAASARPGTSGSLRFGAARSRKLCDSQYRCCGTNARLEEAENEFVGASHWLSDEAVSAGPFDALPPVPVEAVPSTPHLGARERIVCSSDRGVLLKI